MMFENSSHFTTISSMQLALGAATLRQDIIANNITNINTPNFKKQDVAFETALKRALSGEPRPHARRSLPRHYEFTGRHTLDTIRPTLQANSDTTMRNDGNNVDIDLEMANLTKNTVMYNALITRIGDDLKSLNGIITEAGR